MDMLRLLRIQNRGTSTELLSFVISNVTYLCRNIPTYHHNWSDLLFIMDVMEDNAVEPCDILIFISRSDDLITVLEDKKVDVHQSRLDMTTSTLKLVYTSAGIIEKLLGILTINIGQLYNLGQHWFSGLNNSHCRCWIVRKRRAGGQGMARVANWESWKCWVWKVSSVPRSARNKLWSHQVTWKIFTSLYRRHI